MNRDLLTSGTIAAAVCYGDGVDTTGTVINGWTTGANNFIWIFAPRHGSTVGTSQRHSGVWDSSKYRLEVTNAHGIDLRESHVRIEGLQIQLTKTNTSWWDGISSSSSIAADADIRISSNIVRGVISNSSTAAGIDTDFGGTFRVWNNIVYDFTGGGCTDCNGILLRAKTNYVYNNTVHNSQKGINGTNDFPVAKNNIAQDCADGFVGSFDAASDYNNSDIASDAPGSNSTTGPVVFIDELGNDFHLDPSDTLATNQGTDLSSDPNLPFVEDIDFESRSGLTWDMGADEQGAPTAVRLTSFEASGFDSAVQLEWETASEIDKPGLPSLPSGIRRRPRSSASRPTRFLDWAAPRSERAIATVTRTSSTV